MANKTKEIREAFAAEGVSIRAWAKARGFNPSTVHAVISGKLKGNRGIAHRIAVELGLKTEPKNFRFRPLVDVA